MRHSSARGSILSTRFSAKEAFSKAMGTGFRHPVTGETLRFESPLPPDMAKLSALLEDL